jgi:3'-phosphoadenosine 5'-phosphosulfate sulfotransferase (PAPS reductase)/FAD synthetase
MSKIRHVLGISGGKDSAALAIYLKTKYPELDIEYYFCDTGKELKETYQILENLQVFLGKEIIRLRAAKGFPGDPFDYFYDSYGGYLPSKHARWCTRELKLKPFEEFVKDGPVISYVGIRGDEERDGYISKKPNIQSIFPFRKNIWSEDVIAKVLDNENINILLDIYQRELKKKKAKNIAANIIGKKIFPGYTRQKKLKELLSLNVVGFNRMVFEFFKTTRFPLSYAESFPLVDNEDVLVQDDIFKILEESGIGVPEYYKSIEFTVNGKTGRYSRSRSGCFFCFFQQKIEWVWLYEQHPDLFKKAMEYEKSGFTWKDNEKLEDLIKPERIEQIKEDFIKKNGNSSLNQSEYLIDILNIAESEGCAACFL